MKKIILAAFFCLLSTLASAQFVQGTYGASGAAGWSTYTPKTITTGTCAGHDADGTCMWYLSSSGTDSGNCTSASPCQTMTFLYNSHLQFRNGTADWVMLKKGDTFVDFSFTDDGVSSCCWPIFGFSSTFPFALTAYDPATPTLFDPPTGGARPIIKTKNGSNFINSHAGDHDLTHGGNNLVIVGLEGYLYNSDPTVLGTPVTNPGTSNNSGMFQGNNLSFLVMENVKLTYYYQGYTTPTYAACGMVIRRSIIRYSWANGIDSNSQPSTCPNFLIEENVLDHNGWLVSQSNGTLTNLSPTTVTWSNSMPTADRATSVTFSPGCTGLSAGVAYYPYNNNNTTFNISSSPSSNVPVNLGSCGQLTQTITWYAQAPTAFNHNMYIGGWGSPGDNNTKPGPTTFRGNIVSREGSSGQFRSGGQMYENAFIEEPINSNFGNPDSARSTSIFNNVFLSSKENGCACGQDGIESLGHSGVYQSNNYNINSFSVTGNIFANQFTSNDMTALSFSDGFSANYAGNIVYNWGNGGGKPVVGGDGTGSALNIAGVQAGHITNGGSGFTDVTVAGGITGISNDATLGYPVLTVGNTLTAMAKWGPVYIDGMGGGASCPLNQHTWRAYATSSTTVQINNTSGTAAVANCTAGGNIYLPITVSGTPYGLVALTGSGASGTATDFQPMLISAGGTIVWVEIGGSESNIGGPSVSNQTHAGKNYTIGDNLGSPIGSNFNYVVDQVGVFTTTGAANQFFPTGPAQGSCANPSITAASYYDTIVGSGGHTNLDFIDAASNMDKRNWDPRLTANKGLVPAVQAAFGVGSTGVRGLGRSKSLWLMWRDIEPLTHHNDNSPAFVLKAG